MLQGCITALVTPFDQDGVIDYVRLTELVEWQIASGVVGLTIVGSTGEAAALSLAEKLAVIRHVIAVANARLKIIVGSGTAATASTLEFIQELNQIDGIDYVMCLTPYYVKPTQEGMYQHFMAVANCCRMPVILYNVPGRTSCDLRDETILRLAQHHNIHGLKDASGDIKRCSYLVAYKPPGFKLYSGDDETSLAFMLCGGDGVISVASNVAPVMMSTLAQQALAGNLVAARKSNHKLIALYSLLFVEANPIPVKWALFYLQRLAAPTLRLPLTSLSSNYHSQLSAILAEFQ